MTTKQIILWIVLAFVALYAFALSQLNDEHSSRLEGEKEIVILTMIICYESTNQCGVHNIIDENEIEDDSIIQNIEWLNRSSDDLSSYEIEKGLLILRYLEPLDISDRQELINQFMYEYWRKNNDV